MEEYFFVDENFSCFLGVSEPGIETLDFMKKFKMDIFNKELHSFMCNWA